MTSASRASLCFYCGAPLGEDVRLLLVRGRRREAHCSERCICETVETRRKARTAFQTRWLLRLGIVALTAATGHTLWHRHRLPETRSISFDTLASEHRAAPPPLTAPVAYGPPWPPTDDDWMIVFRAAKWIYPLPGPHRRRPETEAEMFGSQPSKDRPVVCRTSDRCGVHLGGELWGEHVYAAQDGVVERVHREGGDSSGGTSIRLAHLGGWMFTQYFHLAGIPRGVVRGARVKAGDVIGLVGDSGSDYPGRHLSFALSVRPSSMLPEVYWDPAPLMANWPLQVPAQGTVAGLVAEARADPHHLRGRR